MEKISIIVPIYNSEKFLERCIDSIMCQAYGNFEVILVNDCSSDKSGVICKEYSRKHNNIKYVEFTENKGVSCARNAGLEESEGALIGFVDSDDWIEPEMYKSLYTALVAQNVSMISSNFKRTSFETQKIIDDGFIHSKDTLISNTLEAIIYTIENFDVILWNKLYRREVFDGIRFPDGKNYEDVSVIHKLVENAGQLAITKESYYSYHQQPISITRDKTISLSIFEHIDAVVDRYYYLTSKYDSKELEQLCRNRIFTTLTHVADKLYHLKPKCEPVLFCKFNEVKDFVFNTFESKNSGFTDSGLKVVDSLRKSITHYKISRDLLRI